MATQTHITVDKPARLLAPHEVAELFRVDAKTVSRWARRGLLDSIRTPAGHRRFFADQVEDLINRHNTAK
ncbi:BldC family transcriptional regulator [Nocardiopsis sp. YSL2]|uniref:BldC family transcriptional regulator n=1 Tax=Nocardiopsis sp. YSL2 TaxID=2939492 RepID=UPI0026F46527|nr:BldC family transcriptional regulator [Nocardiopsis sp. YSL2]